MTSSNHRMPSSRVLSRPRPTADAPGKIGGTSERGPRSRWPRDITVRSGCPEEPHEQSARDREHGLRDTRHFDDAVGQPQRRIIPAAYGRSRRRLRRKCSVWDRPAGRDYPRRGSRAHRAAVPGRARRILSPLVSDTSRVGARATLLSVGDDAREVADLLRVVLGDEHVEFDGEPVRLVGGRSADLFRFRLLVGPPVFVGRDLVVRLVADRATALNECVIQSEVAAARYPARMSSTGASSSSDACTWSCRTSRASRCSPLNIRSRCSTSSGAAGRADGCPAPPRPDAGQGVVDGSGRRQQWMPSAGAGRTRWLPRGDRPSRSPGATSLVGRGSTRTWPAGRVPRRSPRSQRARQRERDGARLGVGGRRRRRLRHRPHEDAPPRCPDGATEQERDHSSSVSADTRRPDSRMPTHRCLPYRPPPSAGTSRFTPRG